MTGVSARGEQLGYGFDEFWLHEPDITPARLIKILESRNIRGVIIAAVLSHGSLPVAFAELWSRFACVAIGAKVSRPPLHFACNDQYLTGMQAVQEIMALGYQRPGFAISEDVDRVVDCRFSAGFGVGQKDLPAQQRLPVFHFTKDGEKRFREWFEKHHPDVVICIHPEVKTWLEAMKMRIPQNVGVVHLDRTAELQGWAGMDQNSTVVGAAAVDMVVGQLHRNEVGTPQFPKCVMIQSTWVPGETVCAQIPQSQKPQRRTAGRLSTHPRSTSES
jgi:LacI family transcriptional regulator